MSTVVTKMVMEDVDKKVDTDYIASLLPKDGNLGIIYVCTDDDRYQGGDDWVDPEDGIRYIVIKLPYKTVKRSADIRPMMLEKLRKRLGKLPGEE
jgi:hypothetical protein